MNQRVEQITIKLDDKVVEKVGSIDLMALNNHVNTLLSFLTEKDIPYTHSAYTNFEGVDPDVES